jgi:hypothetical protein
VARETGFYVYTHGRPDGSVFYVGKGCARRAWWFKRGRNPHHLAIIAKYGAENIKVEILPCESEAGAFALEKKLISELPGLVNMTDGGEGASGRPVSAKVKANFEKMQSARVFSEADRVRSAEIMRRAWREQREKMLANVERLTEARRGVPRSAHVVEALVAANKGKKQVGARLAKTLVAQKIAQEKAKAWHSSEEGKQWHAENGKRAWKNREWVEVACQECGRSFRTPYPTRAKWCDASCGNAAKRRKAGKPVGVRPNRRKTQVLSGKRATCE